MKRIYSMLAALLVLTQLICAIPCVAAGTMVSDSFQQTAGEDGILKVLSIGNSYSQDAMQHLYDVFLEEGYPDVKLAYLYIGGCSLEQHASNAISGARDYQYWKPVASGWLNTGSSSLLEGLQAEDWDVITLQTNPPKSGRPETFSGALATLIPYINKHKTNPDAKLGWHMTWSYSADYRSEYFEYYDSDEEKMYQCIVAATWDAIATNAAFDFIIPSGTAVQNARGSYWGDNLHRDGVHLNGMGCLLAAYTWYATLTGQTLDELKHTMVGIGGRFPNETDLAMVVESVNNAIQNPYAITPSDYPADAHGDCASKAMTDVDKNAWYHEAVDYALANGIMGGYNATTFGPNDTLSRAMVVQVLYNKEGQPAISGKHDFTDVLADQWFNNAVTWGTKNGVMGGYGDGKFGPNDAVTIEQIAVILWNYSGNPAFSGNADSVGAHSGWAANALSWAVENDILEGVPFTNATENATRAQTAQMLMNYLHK